jgi:hypothetical protein
MVKKRRGETWREQCRRKVCLHRISVPKAVRDGVGFFGGVDACQDRDVIARLSRRRGTLNGYESDASRFSSTRVLRKQREDQSFCGVLFKEVAFSIPFVVCRASYSSRLQLSRNSFKLGRTVFSL